MREFTGQHSTTFQLLATTKLKTPLHLVGELPSLTRSPFRSSSSSHVIAMHDQRDGMDVW